MKCRNCGKPIYRLKRSDVWFHQGDTRYCGGYPTQDIAFPSPEGLGVSKISEQAYYTVLSLVEEPARKYVKIGENVWRSIEELPDNTVREVPNDFFIGKMIEFHGIGVHK